jgi:hypothetical protein
MALTLTILANHTFPAGRPITLAALRKGFSVSIAGSVGTGDLAAGAVTAAKSSPGAYWYAAGVYAAGVYAVTLDPALGAYAAGVMVRFRADSANTGAVDVNVNGLGVKNVFKYGAVELEAGDIRSGQEVTLSYDGTNFQIVSPLGNDGDAWHGTTTGTDPDYVLALTPAATALAALEGIPIRFEANFTNVGAATLNVNGLGAKAIRKLNGLALAAGDIASTSIVEVVYDLSQDLFVMTSPGRRREVYAGEDSGAADAYVITPTISVGAYFNGLVVVFKATNSNTKAATINVSGLGVKTIKKRTTLDLQAGDIVTDQWVTLVYDGTNFQLQTPADRQLARAWCKFNGTATSKTVTNTVDTGLDQLTVTTHAITAATDIESVQAVTVRNSGGALPTGLSANTIYFARVVDANTLTLHTTRAGALDNTARVDITANGTGTNTLDYITVNAKYGVAGVIQTSAAGSLVTGEYQIWWAVNFASGHYTVNGNAKEVTASQGVSVTVDSTDAAAATHKIIATHRCSDNTALTPTEVFVTAHGLL